MLVAVTIIVFLFTYLNVRPFVVFVLFLKQGNEVIVVNLEHITSSL